MPILGIRGLGRASRESEKERVSRELVAADERLARVRDGRGYVKCNFE